MKLDLQRQIHFHLPKRAWLRGGVIGVMICFALYLFYLFAFSALRDDMGWMQVSLQMFATATGHLFSLFSGFLFMNGIGCPYTVRQCVEWNGGCTQWVMRPEESCVQITSILGFIGTIILLHAIYFAVGAGVAVFIEKRRNKQAEIQETVPLR